MIDFYFLIQEQPLGKVLELLAAREELRALVADVPVTVRPSSADTVPMPGSLTVPAKRLTFSIDPLTAANR